MDVTPLAGVWIEIRGPHPSPACPWSLPLRECGLKSFWHICTFQNGIVTPLAGVWIEIDCDALGFVDSGVTPLAGVWIEIDNKVPHCYNVLRHSPCGSVD